MRASHVRGPREISCSAFRAHKPHKSAAGINIYRSSECVLLMGKSAAVHLIGNGAASCTRFLSMQRSLDEQMHRCFELATSETEVVATPSLLPRIQRGAPLGFSTSRKRPIIGDTNGAVNASKLLQAKYLGEYIGIVGAQHLP